MITRFETLGPQATIGDAAELLLRTTQHEFPVVDGGGKLRGFLTRNAMVAALSKSGAGTPVHRGDDRRHADGADRRRGSRRR